MNDDKQKAIKEFREAQMKHLKADKDSKLAYEDYLKAKKIFDKTEDQIKAIQSFGLEVGDVIRKLTSETCLKFFLINKGEIYICIYNFLIDFSL